MFLVLYFNIYHTLPCTSVCAPYAAHKIPLHLLDCKTCMIFFFSCSYLKLCLWCIPPSAMLFFLFSEF
uniref:Uncharacterized protein n=1 Tax=Rhizophora mucronata TaxID=61149 RepID=A0A2P2PWV8_RHIMU